MLTLDHVAFGSRDHEEASAAFSSLGFTPSETTRCEWVIEGRHDAASAACIVFESEYLDIVEVSSPGWARNLASSVLYRRGFAPTGIVFSGIDPKLVFSGLSRERSAPAKPYQITRRFEGLDGDSSEEVSYEFLALRSAGLPFGLITDSAPHALRRAGWLAHPNGAFGIGGVHLRVSSRARAEAALHEEPFSLTTDQAAAAGIPVGKTRLHVHQDPRGYLASVAAILPDLSRPSLLALEFRVRALEATSNALRQRGVAFSGGGSALFVEPSQGFGTGIIFRGDAA